MVGIWAKKISGFRKGFSKETERFSLQRIKFSLFLSNSKRYSLEIVKDCEEKAKKSLVQKILMKESTQIKI